MYGSASFLCKFSEKCLVEFGVFIGDALGVAAVGSGEGSLRCTSIFLLTITLAFLVKGNSGL